MGRSMADSDEQIVARLEASPLGTRDLLRVGRIGTLVGRTHEGRVILADARGEFLCVHGDQNSLANKRVKRICSCARFDAIMLNEVTKDPKFHYGLQPGETLNSFLRDRRTNTAPLWAYGNV